MYVCIHVSTYHLQITKELICEQTGTKSSCVEPQSRTSRAEI